MLLSFAAREGDKRKKHAQPSKKKCDILNKYIIFSHKENGDVYAYITVGEGFCFNEVKKN